MCRNASIIYLKIGSHYIMMYLICTMTALKYAYLKMNDQNEDGISSPLWRPYLVFFVAR